MILKSLIILFIFTPSTFASKSRIFNLQTTGIWVKWGVKSNGVPENAVYGGHNKYGALFVIRARYRENIVIGNYSPLRREGYILDQGQERKVLNFEILTHNNYVWQKGNLEEYGLINGTVDQYICRGIFYDSWKMIYIPGRIRVGSSYCSIPYKNRQNDLDVYELLKMNIKDIRMLADIPDEDSDIPKKCGKRIINEENKNSLRDYPWHVTLFNTKQNHFCSATIVSRRKVVTAAHCLKPKGSSEAIHPKDLLVVLGGYNLTAHYEIGRSTYAVEAIEIHEDWDTNTRDYDADIATLILKYKVRFNSFIQPICLTDSNRYFRYENYGTAISYSSNYSIRGTPDIVRIPHRMMEKCINRNAEYAKIMTERTFCAGLDKNTKLCKRNNGGGLYFQQKNTFYFGGIISTSPTRKNDECDDGFSVYTRVESFNDWIRSRDVGLYDIDFESF